ncbi:hypothetical protein ACIBAG_28445 [Streptomyces sp. NPDC051243]|uniref:hypothetical protein n=1 Tax=Streptomyces sp. NPDC051243 TaxID=3365646 RepID=UPI0037ADEBCC
MGEWESAASAATGRTVSDRRGNRERTRALPVRRTDQGPFDPDDQKTSDRSRLDKWGRGDACRLPVADLAERDPQWGDARAVARRAVAASGGLDGGGSVLGRLAFAAIMRSTVLNAGFYGKVLAEERACERLYDEVLVAPQS